MSIFNFLFGKKQLPETVKILDKHSFKEAIANKKVQLLDVRTAVEFNAGHIDGAVNNDYYKKNTFKTELEKLDKEKPVYLYCHSGGRSGNASRLLDSLGFKHIYDLKGGYSSWKR